MSRTSCIVLSPLLTKSGYGHRSLDLCRALIKIRPDWDITFLSQRWGTTPFYTVDDLEINSRIKTAAEIGNIVFDVSINITVPNEFKPYSKFNIGVSAGVETNTMPQACLDGMNRIDLTLMSSEHSKNISQSSKFDGKAGLQKPVETLFEGVDTDVFSRDNKQTCDLDIKEDFCFLLSGMWLPGVFDGVYSHDRKHLGTTIKSFLETFKGNKDVALVIKTTGGIPSISDREVILKKIDDIRGSCQGDLPNIYLVHGDLTTDQLVGLYQHEKIKCLVSVGNEGWNRIPLEFSCATSKPLMMSTYSGHLDYIKPEFNVMVGGSLQPVHQSIVSDYLVPNSKMYYPDLSQLMASLTNVYREYPKYEEMGKRQGHYARTNFSLPKMESKLDEILTRVIPKFSRPQPLQLLRKDLAVPK